MNSLEFAKNWYAGSTKDEEHERRVNGLSKMIDKFFIAKSDVYSRLEDIEAEANNGELSPGDVYAAEVSKFIDELKDHIT